MKSEIGVEDLKGLLDYLTKSGARYALAGGLAVDLWARSLLTDEQKENLGVPLLSEDVDFRGHRFLADGIKAWMVSNGVEVPQLGVAIRKGAEEMGRIFNMPFRPLNSSAGIQASATVEVFERLPLLDGGIDCPPNGTVVVLSDTLVLDPFSLTVCKLHAYHTRPDFERGRDFEHLRILANLLPDAEKLCRSKGVSLSKDAARLQAVLDGGRFPLPPDFAEVALVHSAIAAALN
jgi:hypothetical protein